jgi:two-component system phosphate regulon sensor histidine kinase PhoR
MARTPTGKISGAVIENLTDAVIGIDKEGRVILFNPQAEILFEKKEKEVQGQKIWDILEISDFTRVFISLVKDSDPSRLEQVLPFPGNRIFLVKMHPVRNSDGRVIGAIAILEDLTTIHKMEKTMNEFVAVVSHELKTPLTRK